MKGWVGLVGWRVADSLPTIVVTHQLQDRESLPARDLIPSTTVLRNQPCTCGWWDSSLADKTRNSVSTWIILLLLTVPVVFLAWSLSFHAHFCCSAVQNHLFWRETIWLLLMNESYIYRLVHLHLQVWTNSYPPFLITSCLCIFNNCCIRY